MLQLTDVESGYGDLVIVDGVTMSVDTEEMVTIIGPNGAGKSTLLKTIVGLLPTRHGSIEYNGEDISAISTDEIIDHGISFVPQGDNIFPNLTVEENLKLASWQLDYEYDDRVQEIFDLLPVLQERTNQTAQTLSGGQQQMVAIGMALLPDPSQLILDEPSAGLAPKLVEDIFDKIVDINDNGTAILMVEQNAEDALRRSDRGYVLVQGRDEFEGMSDEILNSEEIAEMYLGSH
jgi:branched-chain amino acid transport system ATP-binding protein